MSAWIERVYDKKLKRYGIMWDEKLDSGWVRWDNDEVEVIKTNAPYNGGARYGITSCESSKNVNFVGKAKK